MVNAYIYIYCCIQLLFLTQRFVPFTHSDRFFFIDFDSQLGKQINILLIKIVKILQTFQLNSTSTNTRTFLAPDLHNFQGHNNRAATYQYS